MVVVCIEHVHTGARRRIPHACRVVAAAGDQQVGMQCGAQFDTGDCIRVPNELSYCRAYACSRIQNVRFTVLAAD
jgi:hypothetical protein